MDPEIKASVRKLFVKFLLFQAVIFAVAVLLAVSFTAYFKSRLGGQLAAASRDMVLSGDSRGAMLSLTTAVAKDFAGMTWAPAAGTDGFSAPPGAEKLRGLFYASARLPLFFDDAGRYRAGYMSFYYSRLPPLLWAVLGWLAILAMSLPVALLERRRLIRDYGLLLDLRVKESHASLAAQVAHDIRSPLAALDSVMKDVSSLPEDRRELARGAVARISEIARDLLDDYRRPGAGAAPAEKDASPQDIGGLLGPVLAEKREQFAGRPGLVLELSAAPGLVARVRPAEFRRLVSNLVNNAVEALEGGGRVSLSAYASGDRVRVEIADDGKGIPPEVLARLGRRGETHGKAGGNGLGLYHARKAAEEWGGSLNLESGPGKGTRVIIELPAAAPAGGAAAFLLDDDRLVHLNWRAAARKAGVDLRTFSDPAGLLAALAEAPRASAVYIDSELAGGVKGEEVAVELHEKGFVNVSMATGHSPQKFSHLPWLKVAGKEPPWGG